MYFHDYSLELPVYVGDRLVAWCPDVDCTLILDEDGDLWKVQLRERGTGRVFDVMSGPAFDAAQEAMDTEGDRIRDEAGFRGDRRDPYARPIMGVGFSGGKYAA